VSKDRKDLLVLQELPGRPGLLDQQDLQVLKDRLVSRALREVLALQEPPEQLALPVLPDLLEQQDRRALKGLPV
jgi:hypothetical protein